MTFNRATFEIPAPAAGHVRIASFRATNANFAEWGFPVRRTEQMMGAMTVICEGFTAAEAAHLALCAGFTFLAIEPFAEWEARRAAEQSAHRAELARRAGGFAPDVAAFVAASAARRSAALAAAA